MEINSSATLQRFADAGIRITAWCEEKKISRRYFYEVINNQVGGTRAALNAKIIKDEIKKAGFLVQRRVKRND